VDVDYIVGQSIVGQSKIDYKSNCGNMTAATAPYAVEMGLVENLTEPVTTVHMFNLNTNKYIDVDVPVKDGRFYNVGDCAIAGIDGTAGELRVNFLNPAGSKTGKLFPTGQAKDILDVPGLGQVEATILDVSNPMVLVRAEAVGADATEMPATVDGNKQLSANLEAVRAAACVKLGIAKDIQDATDNSPAVPKVGFFSAPQSYVDISGKQVDASEMDICARVISVFKCHKAAPLTSACAITVARAIPGTLLYEVLGAPTGEETQVRVGHPSGVMTLFPYMDDPCKEDINSVNVSGVAVQRTARIIMEGRIYINN